MERQETVGNDFSHVFTARGDLVVKAEYSHLGRQWTSATSAFQIGRTMCSHSLTRQVFVPGRLRLLEALTENGQKCSRYQEIPVTAVTCE